MIFEHFVVIWGFGRLVTHSTELELAINAHVAHCSQFNLSSPRGYKGVRFHSKRDCPAVGTLFRVAVSVASKKRGIPAFFERFRRKLRMKKKVLLEM